MMVRCIRRILSRKSLIRLERRSSITQTKPKQVISKETADEMTSMLLGTFSNGTAAAANPAGYTIAGKTGTTETNFDATKANDQWMIGYTPDVVISTWMGYEESSKLHYLEGTSGNVVGKVFKSAAEGILPYTSKTGFSVADAYATGGQVVAADQVGNTGNSNGESGNWQDNLNQYGEQAKEGLKNFGDMGERRRSGNWAKRLKTSGGNIKESSPFENE